MRKLLCFLIVFLLLTSWLAVFQFGFIPVVFADTPESYVYCNGNKGVYTNPANAYDNNTSTVASYSWSPKGQSAYLTLNLSSTAIGTKIRYCVARSNYVVTTLRIDLANQTGTWTMVMNTTPASWTQSVNLTMSQTYQYTALRFSAYKTGTVSRTFYVNETQAVMDATYTSAPISTTITADTHSSSLAVTSTTIGASYDAAAATNYYNSTVFTVGRRRVTSTNYYCFRGFPFFNLSTIPSGATITSFILSLNTTAITVWSTYTVNVYTPESDYVHPALDTPLSEYNYQYYDGGTYVGTNNTALVANTYTNYTLETSAAVLNSSLTKLIVRVSGEFSNSTFNPTSNTGDYFSFSGLSTSFLPKVYVSYTIPSPISVTNPTVSSSYTGTESYLSAYCTATNISVMTLEDNYTSGTIVQTTETPPYATETYTVAFYKVWNYSIVTVKWRIFCNDTAGSVASTEWQYSKITPDYNWNSTTLAAIGDDQVVQGTDEDMYTPDDVHIFNFTAPVVCTQIEFLNITNIGATALYFDDVFAYHAANGSEFCPASVWASSTGTNPEYTIDNNDATCWTVAAANKPASIIWTLSVSTNISAVGVYSNAVSGHHLVVGSIRTGSWGNMTFVGDPPLTLADYPSGYLNSSAVNMRSVNFSFAPLYTSSLCFWEIDVSINWSATNTSVFGVNIYTPTKTASYNLTTVNNATWVTSTIPLLFDFGKTSDINSTYVSFVSYNSTITLIDNCSIIVKYDSITMLRTEYTFPTGQSINNRPIDIFTPTIHALVWAYLNTTKNGTDLDLPEDRFYTYWIVAYDEMLLEWTSQFDTGMIPTQKAADTGHYSPTLALAPNGTLMLMNCHSTPLNYVFSTYSASTETNITKVISSWTGYNGTAGTASENYVFAASFSDRVVLVTTTGGNPAQYNGSIWIFDGTTFSEKVGAFSCYGEALPGGLYAGLNKLGDNKLYVYWMKYDVSAGIYANAYCIMSTDEGDTWKFLNGTIITTFPMNLASPQALIVEEEKASWPTVLDEDNCTAVYYYLHNTTTWYKNESSFGMPIRRASASAIAPSASITWNAPTYCYDEYNVSLTGEPRPIYDYSRNTTSLWTLRCRGEALESPYVVEYQKGADNLFYHAHGDPTIDIYYSYGLKVFEPSVPYVIQGFFEKIGILGYESTGTEFSKSGDLELYPYVASVTEQVNFINIRVNMTSAGADVYNDFILYNSSMIELASGFYGDASVYGANPRDVWDHVPLGAVVNLTAGETYWIGIWSNLTNYYRTASTLEARQYVEVPYDRGTTRPSDLTIYNYTSAGNYTLSVFMGHQQTVFYGRWDFLVCQSYTLNTTIISAGNWAIVEFSARWLDYRGLSFLWFQENSTGSYSVPEYNNTGGDGTSWCNRTYNITGNATVYCQMLGNNSLGESATYTMYIESYTLLYEGWNNISAASPDIGKTLGQICANIQYDLVDAEIIVFGNGSEYQYDYGYQTNFLVVVTSTSETLGIYCLTEGTWYRSYTNYAWLYINSENPQVSDSSTYGKGKGFSFPESPLGSSLFSGVKGLLFHFLESPSSSSLFSSVKGLLFPFSETAAASYSASFVKSLFFSFAELGQGIASFFSGYSLTFNLPELTHAAASSTLNSGRLFLNQETAQSSDLALTLKAFGFLFSENLTALSQAATLKALGFQFPENPVSLAIFQNLKGLAFRFSEASSALVSLFNLKALGFQFSEASSASSVFSSQKSLMFHFSESPFASGIGSFSLQILIQNLFFNFAESALSTATLTQTKGLGLQFPESALSSSLFTGSKGLGFQFAELPSVASVLFNLKSLGFQFAEVPAISSIFSSQKSLLFQFSELSYASEISTFLTQVMSNNWVFNFVESAMSTATFTQNKGLDFKFLAVPSASSILVENIGKLFMLSETAVISDSLLSLKGSGFQFSEMPQAISALSIGKGLIFQFPETSTSSSIFNSLKWLTFNFNETPVGLSSFSTGKELIFNFLETPISASTFSISVPGGTTTIIPGGTQNPYSVLFIVTNMKYVPLENASITLYLKADQELVSQTVTNRTGYVEMTLAPGEYVFTVTWHQFNYTSAFLHVEEETVKVQLNTEVAAPFWMRILFFGIIGAVLIGGSSLVIRTRRQRQKRRSRTRSPAKPDKHKIKYPEGKPKEAPKHKIDYPDYIGYG